MSHPFSVPLTNGLYVRRPRTCPCGVVFVARKPAATYCSNACRRRYGRYGRTTYPARGQA